MARVLVQRNGAEAQASPEGYLGDAFHSYRAACEAGGFRFKSTPVKANYGPVDRVPTLVLELGKRGLEAVVAADLAADVSQEKAAAVERAQVAVSRAKATFAQAGLALYPFQEEGVGWLASRKSALLADEMGLGKTVQTLCALPESVPVLIICPASLKGNWRDEAAKWRTDYRVGVLSGGKSFRWPECGEILVMNYDILPGGSFVEVMKKGRLTKEFKVKLPEGMPAGLVVAADESQAIKNSKSQRTQLFRALTKAAVKAGGRVWLLTGTPIVNRQMEAWSVLAAADLQGEAFGSWRNFLRVMNGHEGRWGGYEFGEPTPEAAQCLRKVMLRRHRLDVLPDLPGKTYRILEVNDLGASLRKMADALVAKLEAKGLDLERMLELAARTRGCVPGFEEFGNVAQALAIAKIPALMEQVEQYEDAEEPLVVFSGFLAPVEALEGRPGWAAIHGAVPSERRTEIVRKFQAGLLKGVACTIGAGGVGLTLTRSANVLFVDRDYTPAMNAQCEDRCCRIGQTRGVMVTHLVAAHALDQRLTEILLKKQAIIAATTETAAYLDDEREGVELVVGEVKLPKTEAEAQAVKEQVLSAKREAMGYRDSRNELEMWAAEGIVTLMMLDRDHASAVNGMGFNKTHSEIGHEFANRLLAGQQFTDKQWELMVRMASFYRGQLGPRPQEVA